ncbi:hypothetical protein KFL_003060020 [Klebsormidium nitens]|uniref:S1 motif domain-containing protein n=1 Tax=Klebsormidium nitens TaxID=105231 RepID=A0A1Y1I852_KLENI|nr:hypothetical protein KFL_003060020 [Klebsormidium nitens]|eukprot:GAQ86703.1 hypothetical protein KFL_003060020 [Klebsormidium nitens]
MDLQVLSRRACPLSSPASGFGSTRARAELSKSSNLLPFFGRTSKTPFLDGRGAVKFSKGFGRQGQVRGAVKGAFDGKGGAEGSSGNGRFSCRYRLPTLQQGAKSALSTSKAVTSLFISPSCHIERTARGGNRRRRAGKVRAITTDEAYETLADLEKRLDEEGGEYDDEEYYEILPDKRRAATEPVRKVMDLSWLWLLEELPGDRRSRPEEAVRYHWRWAVEGFLCHMLGDNWPDRLARLTRTGELALYPVHFQPQEMPYFEAEVDRIAAQDAEMTGKAHLQSKRRLEKEKQRIREKLEDQWEAGERMRAGDVRAFFTEEEEARYEGFWAAFEGRFGGNWKERLVWDREARQWELDGEVVRPAEELASLVYGADWLQRARKVHGDSQWWRAIQAEKGKQFWAQQFQQSDALMSYMRQTELWPHRVWLDAKDEVTRIVKAGKQWPAIWTTKKEETDDEVWLRIDEADKLFHREEQLTLRKYTKGLIELEMNLHKEPEYVELRRQHEERQLEKKEWRFGALAQAYSRLFMVDGRFTTVPEEEEKRRKAAEPPVHDLPLPYDYHLEPNPLRDVTGRPRDAFLLPRNRKVPKSWPPPGWEVPADELAFLKEGEDERDLFAEAAQQAIEKLGPKAALEVVKQSGELVRGEDDDKRWRLFLKQYHEWRDANLERLDKEGKEMDALFPMGYEPGRRRVGKGQEQPTEDKEVRGMYELPFLERGQVYEGFVTGVDLHAGAIVAYGGVHDGYIPVLGDDWRHGNLWDIIEVGTKCLVQVVAVRDPFRFRYPVEMRFLDPDVTPLLKETKFQRSLGSPIIGRKEDVELEEVLFESGRKYTSGPRERVEEALTAFDLEHMTHPDQEWLHRKGIVEQRLLANEEYEAAVATGSPLPFPVFYDWDYIADPNKRLEILREHAKAEKLTEDGRSTLPRDQHRIGQLMEDKRPGVSVTSRVTIESYTERMSEKERSQLDLESARRERQEIRATIMDWLEQAGEDWTTMDAEELEQLFDDVEETRPRFSWEEETARLLEQEVAYYRARLLAHEEYDAEVKLRGLWNETPIPLPDIDLVNKGELDERPTPLMIRDRMRRGKERLGDDDRPFPDIPSRKEEWRAENAVQNALVEAALQAEKDAEEAAKAAQVAAERRAAGIAETGDVPIRKDAEVAAKAAHAATEWRAAGFAETRAYGEFITDEDDDDLEDPDDDDLDDELDIVT